MGTHIILDQVDSEKKIAVFTEHITAIVEFEDDNDGCKIILIGDSIVVKQSYKEVMARLF